MNRIDGYTPKQLAYDIAMGWLRQVHNQHTADLQSLTPSQLREVQHHLAKLHDRLLDEASLDGSPLVA